MPRSQSGGSGPTLRKSQRPCGGLQNCLARRLLVGGVPGPGVVVERSYIPSQPYEIAKNGEKTGGFAHVWAYKLPKMPFFALKYSTRYTHKTFSEVYTNFEGPYLSRCRDIPLQSFGSHIRPQPHGLGLTLATLQFTLSHRSESCSRCNTMAGSAAILSCNHQQISPFTIGIW